MLDIKDSLYSKPSDIYTIQQSSLHARRAMLRRIKETSLKPKKNRPATSIEK